MKLELSRQIFEKKKDPKYQISWKFVQSEPCFSMRKDDANRRFSQFCEKRLIKLILTKLISARDIWGSLSGAAYVSSLLGCVVLSSGQGVAEIYRDRTVFSFRAEQSNKNLLVQPERKTPGSFWRSANISEDPKLPDLATSGVTMQEPGNSSPCIIRSVIIELQSQSQKLLRLSQRLRLL